MASPQGIGRSRRLRLTGLTRGVGNDDGTSLIELVVGIMLMSVFSAFFTVAVVSMNRAENKTEAVSLSTSQLNQAFLALDKTVRYASAISQPGTGPSGDWYVELRATNAGSEVCTQLRIDAQQLQRRTWTFGSAPSGWAPLTSNVINGGAPSGGSPVPFVLVIPGADDVNAQRLTFNLVTLSAPGAAAETTSSSSVTFTAVNSTVPAPSAPICQDQVRQ